TSPSSTVQQLLQEAIISTNTDSIPPEENVMRAYDEDIALMLVFPNGVMNNYADFGDGEGIIGSRGICQLREVPDPLSVSSAAYGVPRNSPLTEMFNSRISWLVATGLWFEIKKQEQPEEGEALKCLEPTTTNN
ncbi:unnamed protein product, partial [Meganyctiphanes norvegica]